MEQRINFIKYTWEKIEQDTRKLAEYITQQITPNSKVAILAIARSGSIPATILSNLLKQDNKVFTCNYTRYQNEQNGNLMQIIQTIPLADIVKYLSVSQDKRYVFIIDTIVDKGDTIKQVSSDLHSGLTNSQNIEIQTLALYKMQTSIENVNCYINDANTSDWIELPWEVKS